MVKLLKTLGLLSIVGGIILGIYEGSLENEALSMVLGSRYEQEFRWSLAVTYWISGVISSVIFYAIAMTLEKLDFVIETLYPREHTPKAGSLGNSKMDLSKLDGFKLGSHE